MWLMGNLGCDSLPKSVHVKILYRSTFGNLGKQKWLVSKFNS